MQKKFYEAPVAEQMEIRLEAGFLTISGGSATAPNVESMNGSDICDGAW